MEAAFVVEPGLILIRWMDANFIKRLREYTARTGDWGFQLEQDHIIYDVDIYHEYSVARNMQTGEQYAVYLTSSMKPTGPGGH